MRCPTCGNETTPLGEVTTSQAEWHARQMANAQNIDRSYIYGMQSAFAQAMRYGGRMSVEDSIDHSKDEPIKKQEPTSWQQFKTFIREMIP